MEKAFEIPPDLEAEWKRLLAVDRHEAEDLYFEKILPPLLDHLEALPGHVELRDRGFHTLASLMGYSPETTILATCILRPKKLVVLASSNTLPSYDRAHAFLSARSVLPPSAIFLVPTDPTDHGEIYARLRERIGDEGDHIVDVTGGKKVMSATAAQVAWELNLPLCYVESPKYNPQIRRPDPGCEELIVLPNPSEERARLLRRRAVETFGQRRFAPAAEAFGESRRFQADNSFDNLGYALARCYTAWADLDRGALADRCRELRGRLEEPRIRRLLPARMAMSSHLKALEAVAAGEELPLLATFFELGDIYERQGRADFAVLLVYRAMEALVDYALRRATGGRFLRHDPDWSLFGDEAKLRADYVELSHRIGRRGAESLPDRVGFIGGFAVLCLTTSLAQDMPTSLSKPKLVARYKGLAELRNRSILAHGTQSLGEAEYGTLRDAARDLATGVLGDDAERLEARRATLRPRDIARFTPA